MGSGRAGLHSSRSEFLAADALNDEIEYKRNGGCFVTTKKAIAYLILAILASIVVGVLVYLYGPHRQQAENGDSNDIEKLLNNSINSVMDEEDKLPTTILPLHYQLRIKPVLNENSSENFTFTGQITILVTPSSSSKKIILNVDDLEINEVTVSTSRNMELKSASQIKEADNTTNSSLPTQNNSNLGTLNTTQTDLESGNPAVGSNNTVSSNQTLTNTNTSNITQLNSTSPNNLSNSTINSINTTQSSTNNSAPNPQNLNSTTGFNGSLQNSTTDSNGSPQNSTTGFNGSLPNSTNENSTNNSVGNTQSQNSTGNPEIQNSTTSVSTTSAGIQSSTVPSVIPLPSSQPKQSNSQTDPMISETTTSIPIFPSVYQSNKIIKLIIRRTEEIKEDSKYIINLMENLKPGKNYSIDIQFRGKISSNFVGLYRTSYKDANGSIRWLVTTQLSPSYARKVFPCFDDPSFKAPFSLSVARKTDSMVLSNMPVKETEPINNNSGWVWDHFQTTPPLPTHLVTFTISNFEKLPDSNATNVGPVFNFWAPKHMFPTLQYAHNSGKKILTFMEDYFGVKYPSQKIDFLVIPEMIVDTMSCWGSISIRLTSAVLDPNSDNWEVRNKIFSTVAEGLAQQWFGNLITIKTWSDLWIKRSFSIFMAEVAKSSLEPSVDYYNSFPVRIMHSVMYADSLKSTGSLFLNSSDSFQIEQFYDDIMYKKGACLLRMLNYTTTETIFKEVIRNYFRQWSDKSFDQNDFWSTFSELNESGAPIEQFMNSWIKQNGYPLITVQRNHSSDSIIVKQKRFIEENISSKNLWMVPLTYQTSLSNGSVKKLWIKDEMLVLNETFRNTTWLLFNVDETGFYRVNYDEDNWLLLKQQLENDPNKIPSSSRAQLLDDAFELAKMDVLSYNISMNLTKYLSKNEENYIPWAAGLKNLEALKPVFIRSEYYGSYRNYIIGLISNLYQKLGTTIKDGESMNDRILRSYIIKTACNYEFSPCVIWAKEEYNHWMNNSQNSISYDFRETVMCTAIRDGGSNEWEFLWNKTLSPSISSADLKIAYLSLGCTKEIWLIHRYLKETLRGKITLQNIPYVWESINHAEGLNIGLQFLREKWNKIDESYEEIYSVFKHIIQNFISKLSTKSDLEDLTLFYKNHTDDLKSLSPLMVGAVDRIKLWINWREKHLKIVSSWLDSNIN